MTVRNGVARMKILLRIPPKNRTKIMPRIASKVGAILKGTNLLPREQIRSFMGSPYVKEQNILC